MYHSNVFVFFDFSSKNGQKCCCKNCFDIPFPQALSLSPLRLVWEGLVDLARVHNMSWVLHCFKFDAALPNLNQHFNTEAVHDHDDSL